MFKRMSFSGVGGEYTSVRQLVVVLQFIQTQVAHPAGRAQEVGCGRFFGPQLCGGSRCLKALVVKAEDSREKKPIVEET